MNKLKYFVFLSLFFAISLKGQIQVSATVKHAEPWTTSYQGSIRTDVTGGVSPYTYTFYPDGVTTSSIGNAVQNYYTLKVKGSNGDSVMHYYDIGYKTYWFNFTGCKFRNDSLMSDGNGSYTNRVAITKNTLLSYSNGWVEYIHPPSYSPYVIGFLDSLQASALNTAGDFDFAFHVSTGNNFYACVNGSFTWLGVINTGDVLKAERTGSLFSLKLNSVTVYTLTAQPAAKLKVKGNILTQAIANVGVSFEDTTSLFRLKTFSVKVDHVMNDGSDSLGNIISMLNDGYPPYKYYWSPGNINTRNLTEKAKNYYTIKVKDAINDSATYSYNLGYKTSWANFYGTQFRNDSLMAAPSATYVNKSAVTKNTLWANTDGWVEMVTPEFAGSSYVVGFLDSVYSSGSHTDNDFAWHVTTGGALYAWSSGYFTYLGTANTGDVMKLQRTGRTFYLKKNNVTLYTDVAIVNKKLKVKAQINTLPICNIGVSFNDTVSLLRLTTINAAVDHVNILSKDTAGSVYPIIADGSPPYTYTWNPGNTHNKNIVEVGKNQYTLTVRDSKGDQVTYNYNLGYKTAWMNFYGTTFSNDSLKSDGGAYVNRTAISLNKLAPNTSGWVELVTQPYVTPYMVGFLDSAYAVYVSDPYDMDFAFHLTTGNSLYSWAGGAFTYLGTCVPGDVIRIERTGSNYYLKKNNTALFTATAVASDAQRIKGLIRTTPLLKLGSSFPIFFNINTVPYQTHYAILKKKLDAGYYNTILNSSNNQTFYFMFDEEYYNPNTNNLTYTITNNSNSSTFTLPALVRKIGDNRFALDVTTISPPLSAGFYKITVRNEKNEVWQARIKVN